MGLLYQVDMAEPKSKFEIPVGEIVEILSCGVNSHGLE